jgi:hypothetical protein
MTVVIFLFTLSYLIPFLFDIALMALGLLAGLLLLDWLVLYSKRNPVSVERILPERLSNGDGNTIYCSEPGFSYWMNFPNPGRSGISK